MSNTYVHVANFQDFYYKVAMGKVDGHSIVQKFGRNPSVTSIVPVSIGGVYRTPTGTATLVVQSSNANDTAAGTGGQAVTIIYLDQDFNEQIVEIETNGTSESTQTITNVKRLYRAYVSRSGTYATQASASHLGTITIREQGAGQIWAQITVAGTNFGVGQTQIGAYTVPANHTGLMLSKYITVDSARTATIYFFQRQNSDDVTAPYTGTMRLVEQEDGISSPIAIKPVSPLRTFPEKTDIGFMAQAAVSASISVDFELLVIRNDCI